jgi:protocatechuate 3,4-dioxygenase beta subunit
MMAGGVTVRGKVTNKAGKPVARARVVYHPLHPNIYVNSRQAGSAWTVSSTALSEPDGSYTLTVLPGPGVIGVAAAEPDEYMPAFVSRKELAEFFKTPLIHKSSTRLSPGEEDQFLVMALAPGFQPQAFRQADHNALVLLEPGEKEKTLAKDVVLEAPVELKGRVVGPDGQPLTGVTVLGLGRDRRRETLKGAEFIVRGLNPRAKGRHLVFRHQDKNLGSFVKESTLDKPGPLTVELQPCGSVSGRIVDRDGKPVAGLRLRLDLDTTPRAWGDKELVTDKEGRFRAKALVPGARYDLILAQASAILALPPDCVFAGVSVEPGKHQDLGDLKPGR